MLRPPRTQKTKTFYDHLMNGGVSRGLWGEESRFDPDKIANNTSVRRHFGEVMLARLTAGDRVLDLGCGPGGFLSVLAPHVRSIVGIDLSPLFIEKCRSVIVENGFANARTEVYDGGRIPLDDASVDAVMLVDVIHHMENVNHTIGEVIRVLRPHGRLFVFEPNVLNPALAAMCLVDRNEWGLFRFGRGGAYRRLLADSFRIKELCYSGLLIGPTSKTAQALGDFFSGPGKSLLGWLSPKHFIEAEKLS